MMQRYNKAHILKEKQARYIILLIIYIALLENSSIIFLE